MDFTFLFDGLIVALISGVLAVIIVVIDRFVNNYGEVTIDINDKQKELTLKGGSPLLTTLAAEQIYIPSACGGRGTCGACKVKILTDIGPVYPTETPFMTPQEIADQTRLSCQVKVKKDLSLSIPEELFNIKKFSVQVERIIDVTHDIKRYILSCLRILNSNLKRGNMSSWRSRPTKK